MPLSRQPECYVNVPLEQTYMEAYRGVPQRLKAACSTRGRNRSDTPTDSVRVMMKGPIRQCRPAIAPGPAYGSRRWDWHGGWPCPLPPALCAAGPDHDKVKPVVEIKAVPFDLEDVRLLDGPFKHAMELDHKYLLSLDVDRLLHNFRINAGLPSSAEPLGGWEEPKCELRGHFVGHYLSGLRARCTPALVTSASRKKETRWSPGWRNARQARHGYLSAFPETFFDRVRSAGVWAP